jgi:anti-anti-sigma factor
VNEEPGQPVEVQLLAVPVAVHRRSVDHVRDLERELELIRHHESDESSVPHRLRALIDELTEQYGGVGEQPSEELDAAIGRGDDAVDLVYRIPASAGEGARRLSDLLDEVDEYCRTGGHLLTLVTPPESLEYRRWFLGEFVRQADGQAATPWPQRGRLAVPHDAPGPPPVPSRPAIDPPTEWTIERGDGDALVAVTGPLDLVSAPPLRDVLVDLLSNADRVTVDLTACGFVDSVGMSVIAAASVRAEEQGIGLGLRLSEGAQRVMRISGLLDRVHVED